VRSALLLLWLISYSAHAETWLSTSILSYHFDRETKHNENNYGIGVKHFVDERNLIAAGVYRNSNEIDSGYLVAGRCFYRSTYVCAGGIAGLVTGYERYAIPMAGPALTLHSKTWGVTLLGFPKDGGVMALTIERRFW
jgi:hypothetical protein